VGVNRAAGRSRRLPSPADAAFHRREHPRIPYVLPPCKKESNYTKLYLHPSPDLLRILETFTGILFLTTNRPGVLDEAVKSRVHAILHYRPLSLEQTLSIFRLNVARLEAAEAARADATGEQALVILDDVLAFAAAHYDKHSGNEGLGRWNGRQIRNAFLIASSLARYQVAGRPRIQPQLRASHFEEVERLTLDYDRARAKTLGRSDANLAHERQERYDLDLQSNRPGYESAPASFTLGNRLREPAGAVSPGLGPVAEPGRLGGVQGALGRGLRPEF
jgi:hypothetical protein